MNKAQIIASLKAARLFRGLPDNEIESLAGAAAVIRYETNAIIIFRGDPAEQVYLVLDGSVGTGAVAGALVDGAAAGRHVHLHAAERCAA